MAPVRNPQAAAARPSGILTPSSSEVASLLNSSSQYQPLKICSGGTTSRCAAEAHWTVDLSPKLRQLVVDQQTRRVRFGSGWTMGELQGELAQRGCMVTTGLSGLPGVGFVLTGGMGPLSRSLGLAIDHVQSLSGIWGNGQPFALKRAELSEASTKHSNEQWTALRGAAPFLGVVQEIELRTLHLLPLTVVQGCVDPNRLAALITAAEHFPRGLSLQWCWGEAIEVMLVARCDDPKAVETLSDLTRTIPLNDQRQTTAAGLHQLPAFGSRAFPSTQDLVVHQEVIGLLGPGWGKATPALLQALNAAMANRPHPRCSLSNQQLGGAVADCSSQATAFRHREAEWKPWITASWPPDDHNARQAALNWLVRVWEELRPYCPGIHLAQLHDHLPWHGRELEAAFGPWLTPLRQLKQQLDPEAVLPPL